PSHLGHDRGGGDRGRDPVPLPHGQGGGGEPAHREAVGEDVAGTLAQAGQGPAHAFDIGDVQAAAVDLGGTDGQHVPVQGPAHDLLVGGLALLGGEQLG